MQPLFFQRLGVRIKKDAVLILRFSHKDFKSGLQISPSEHLKGKSEKIGLKEYPSVKKLQLPFNVRDMPNCEKTGFSSERARDISSTCIAVFSRPNNIKGSGDSNLYNCDVRLDKHNCLASVNLSSSMQTNVPYPFHAKAKITHLNMPGDQSVQQAKYTSEQLHNFHPMNYKIKTKFISSELEKATTPLSADLESNTFPNSQKRSFSTEVKNAEETAVGNDNTKQNNKLEKPKSLKDAIKEYGATVVVLHITLSLASLGIFYVIVNSGVDIEGIIRDWGWSEGASTAGTVGPFVVAYAVHKVFAPIRISLSLFLTPFVVRYLRKRGFKVKPK